MVDGNIEEALDLVGVEIHGDHTVNTGGSEQIGHKFGAYRHAGLILAVLTGPSK